MISVAMKDNRRKCVKCKASTAEKPDLVLHRFPKPGASNLERMVAWAEFCYPKNKSSSIEFLKSLYTSHKMLCNKHFPQSAFVENHLKQMKLHRYAIPLEHSTTQAEVPSGTNSAETSGAASSKLSCIEMTNAPTSQVDMPFIQVVEASNSHHKITTLNHHTYRFPKDKKTAAKWRKHVPGKISKTSGVCSDHFKDVDYVYPGKNRLDQTAVPSIFPEETEQNSVDEAPSEPPSPPVSLDGVPRVQEPEETEQNSVDEAPSEPPSPPVSLDEVPRVQEPEMEDDVGNWIKRKLAENKLNLEKGVSHKSNCQRTKQTSKILKGIDNEQVEHYSPEGTYRMATNIKMPLTGAEKTKHRGKLKRDHLEEYKAQCKRNSKRLRKKPKNIVEMTSTEAEEQRKKWREDKRKIAKQKIKIYRPPDLKEIQEYVASFWDDSDETVCRICLRSGFERKKEFDEKLTKFHVQLCENDVIAIQSVLAICPICEHLLRKFYNFKQKCIQVNTLLKNSRASALEKYGYENLHMLIPSSIGLLKPSDRQGIYNFEHITKSFTVFPSHTVKKPVIDTVKLEPLIENLNPVVNLNRETITQNDNLNPVVNLNRETITQNANLNPVVNLNRETITHNANLNPVVNLNRRTITQNANLNPVVNLNRETITQNANLNHVVNLNRETITQNANLNPVVNLNRRTITQNANLNPVVNLNRETITQNDNLNPVVTLNRGIITLSTNLNPVVRINRETMAAERKGKLNPSIVKLIPKKSKKVNLHPNFVNRKTQDTETKSNPLPVFTPVSTKHRTNIRFDTLTVTSGKKNGMNPKLNPETPNIIEPNWEPEVIAPDIYQTVIKTEDEDIQDPLLVSNSIDNTVLMQFMEDSIDMDLKEDSDETDARGNGSEDEPLTKYRRTDEEIEYLEEEYLESDYDEEIT